MQLQSSIAVYLSKHKIDSQSSHVLVLKVLFFQSTNLSDSGNATPTKTNRNLPTPCLLMLFVHLYTSNQQLNYIKPHSSNKYIVPVPHKTIATTNNNLYFLCSGFTTLLYIITLITTNQLS